MTIESIMRLAPVIPVIVIEDANDALAMGETLVAAGHHALEVTLRTPDAFKAIRAMSQVDGAVVGAGTVLNPDDLKRAIDAGARFIVSPGLTEAVVRAAQDERIPILPGVATASDIMRGLEMGLGHFKFFPAVANGGIPALKALAAPFNKARFCPTGGITADTAGDWLSLEAVLCVGGTWMLDGLKR
ncbi:bifunctional 4-hydroxy-2-oxoglutarate aldolase/2-dehydro-3-deoxy-phosphogluconate aldolase [Sphingomonas montanisoli]|uniref:Bifunctional 4-hydroxy-2-oxoglutarate aldolase/2-dehydro-3-deoxy-phosphogluconate aldolase n=1 Tax=Sphingomonas montanisoli TaxID=2606412 RepID=A0A5D9CB26_9SPHN|nr:bifunctional 4-hydroxy-2-oxoglutarate aldolase/2-dehydro-3-deoxy-phosphogluconate aldolase [Sphingomonas montanisoli]TZG27321.1 bifunctional 4-hydroxy-2-oxoglutarate aldolase/2-dehydro-3-deoxy-phosphogluconate aldolase [Sphingomonas montanisoli]